MHRFLPLTLLLLLALFAGGASAQTTTVAKWDFGTSAFSRDATTKSPLISTSPFNLNNSVITLTQKSNTNGNTGRFAAVGSWTNTATNNTSARTALTPRANTKSMYANFTIRPEATGDFSNLTMSFKYQRTASSAPTKVRAFLTWQNGSTYYTRYSSLISLSTTTSTTTWSTSPSITFNTGTTAFPSGTALANKNFLLELEFSTVSSTTNSINLDDIALTANSLCSNVQIGSSGALAAGTMGTALSRALSVSGGIGSYTWSVVDGALPPGVTLNTSTGVVSGTPVSWGDFAFTIRAADSVGCSDDSDFTLNVAPAAGCGSLVEWDFSNYAAGTTIASTVATPILYSFLDSRASATGIISPSSANMFGGSTAEFLNLDQGTHATSFTVSVPAGATTSWDIVDLLFDFQAETASPTGMHVEIAKLNTATGLYDKFYTGSTVPVPNYTLGFANYRHSTNGGTSGPAAFDSRINPGETFKFSIVAEGTVANAAMDLSGVQLLGCAVACPTVAVSPSSVPNGLVGGVYSQTFAAGGGTAPYTWSVSAGTLPSGLTLNSSTGELAGTPTTVATSVFTVRATGSDGCSGSSTISYTVDPARLSVGNLVWHDDNDNGRFDTGEGVSGVTVQIYNSSNILVGSQITDDLGLFSFDSLVPGTYYLKVPASEFASGRPLFGTFSLPGAGGDNGRDDDWDENGIDDAAPATNGIRTANFTLAVGTEPTAAGTEDGADNGSDDATPGDSNGDMTIDFGFCACYRANLAPNGSFETANPSNATFTNTFAGSANTSRDHPTAGSWNTDVQYVGYDPGSYVDAADKATDGNRMLYLQGNSGAGLGFNTAGTVTAGVMNLTPGTAYNVQFDWAPFDSSDPTASNTATKGAVTVDVMFYDSSWTTATRVDAITIYEMTDMQTGATAANPRVISPWTNLAWKKVRTTFVLPAAPAGFPNGMIFVTSNGSVKPLAGTSKALIDNVVITPACTPHVCMMGNLVFKDANYNGIYDSGEGADNVPLNLFRVTANRATDNPVMRVEKTYNGGRYLFSATAGSYFVEIPASAFATGAPLVGYLSKFGSTADDGKDDDDSDGDNGIDNLAPATNGIISNTVVLTDGGEQIDAGNETGFDYAFDNQDDDNGELTIDFAFQLNPVGMGNLVFFDANNNGKYDAGEGVGGVNLELLNTSNVVIATTTTSSVPGEVGKYSFFSLAAGSYKVRIPATEFTAGRPLYNMLSIAPSVPTDDTQDDNTTTGDNGVDNATPEVNGILSPLIALTNNGEVVGEAGFLATQDDVDDGNFNLTVDFGFSAGATDYGDYPLFASASQAASTNIRIGTNATDGETVNPTTGLATVDNSTGLNDEELLMPTVILGSSSALSIPVNIVSPGALSGSTARLGVWVDWNGDGDVLDTGEALAVQTVNATGSYSFTLTPPVGTVKGTKYLRMRLTEGSADPVFSGSSALDGEVEDYPVNVSNCLSTGPGFAYGPINSILYELDVATGRARQAVTLPSGFSSANATAYMDNLGANGAVAISTGSSSDTRLAMWDRTTGVVNVTAALSTFGVPSNSLLRCAEYWNGYYWFIPDNTDDLYKVTFTGGSGTYAVATVQKVSDIWSNAKGHGYGDLVITDGGTAYGLGSRTTDGATEFYTMNMNAASIKATALGTPSVFQNGLAIGRDENIYGGLGLFSNNTGWYSISKVNGTSALIRAGTISGMSDMTICVCDPAPILQTDDYGDYQGFASATQKVSTAIRIGTNATDADPFAFETNGTGDDATGTDDEDLTMPTITTGTGTTLSIPVTITAGSLSGSTARLGVWIDWNGDNDVADANETLTAQTVSASGTFSFTLTPPTGTTAGTKYARIRITEGSTAPTFSGTSTLKGEVEDYPVTVVVPATLDYGDHTGFAAASQTASTAIRVGTNATDAESLNPSTGTANADDTTATDDEDLTMPFFTVGLSSTLSIPVTVTTASLSGNTARLAVFVDWNGDGDVLDANETLATQTVGATGTYSFTLTPPAGTTGGTKYLRIRICEGSTAPASSGASTLKGEVEDYAISVSAAASIGNLVWSDANRNGIKDAAELGVPGATVKLYTSTDLVVGDANDALYSGGVNQTTTAADGSYSFAGLPAGRYFVEVMPPSGYPVVSAAAVTLDNQINNDNNGSQPSGPGTAVRSPVITLTLGGEPTSDGDSDPSSDLTVDFGLFSGFHVGNLVWNDANNNGTKDVGELGISDVVVEILSPGADNVIGGTGSNADTVVSSDLTDVSGNYDFVVYTAGRYFVRVTPAGAYPLASSVRVATDNGVDNDNNGSQTGGAGNFSLSPIFTLVAGLEPGTAGTTNTEGTIDFGMRACPTIALSPSTLPSTTQNAAYSQTMTASGGVSPYNWLVAGGTLPAGISLSTAGVLSGTVTGSPGTYTVAIQAMDSLGCMGVVAYSLTVNCPTLTVTTASLPNAPQLNTYPGATLAASGGTAPYSWAISSGALPAGLSLSSSGAISGTATAVPGTYNFTVGVTDSLLCAGSKALSIIVACPAITVSPTNLANGTLNVAYNAPLSASGGTLAYSWTTVGTWPAGISMSAGGVVSGTPTAVTSGVNGASVAVRATDANSCLVDANVNIKICPTIALSPSSLPAPTVGVAYNQTITQTGSVATPIAWSATGLPAWLSIAPSTGVLSGTPTTTTSATFTVTATDANGCAGSHSYTITPVCPTISIGGTLPSTATQTQAYGTQTLTASGGTSPYSWTVSSGVLPAGLTFNSGVTATTATVSGTPSAVETQTFTIRVQDANGCAASMNATITVSTPPMSIGNLVWNDVNNNGVKDATEVGINGLTVQLFNPGGDNLVNTADDTQVGAGTTTSVTGGYGFANLAPGKYYVKVTPSGSYPLTGGTAATADNDVDNNNDGSQPGGLNTPLFSPIITLTAGSESTTDGDTNFNTNFTVDFGLFTGILLGDTVFNDANNNGVKDAGESGISGLTVELLDGTTSAVITSTTTNASGNYGFTVYTAGSYKVRVTPNAAYPMSSPTAGTDNATNDNNDGTQSGGMGTATTSFTFNLTPGGEPGTAGTTNTENTIDFGFFMPTTDFGDFASFADASSTMVSAIKLGAGTDTEYTASKNATATGDDSTGIDDEDAATFSTLRQAQPATITVNVTNTSASAAYLNAWIDWNNNGVLTDAGDQIATNVAIAAGTSNSNQTLNITVPATATVGTVGARFRFTDVQNPGATGANGNGEVEDHVVGVLAANTDFGDFSGFASATSIANSTIKLGTNAGDTEAALTPNAAATADDTTGTDDEDGVAFPAMTSGQSVIVPVVVTNTSGAAAYLNAWIDFNNNGVVTDSGEQVATNVLINTGTSGATQNVSFAVPSSAVTTSAIGARFRITSVSSPGFSGAAGTGEVEDYAVTIQSPITDFGDWSGVADAWNNATSALRMGVLVDSEYASTRNATATGDDVGGTDDEDGVTLPSMTAGQTVAVPVVVTNTTGASAFLNAWIDFNNNGSFADAGEQIASNVTVANGVSGGTQNVTVNVPTTATTGVNLGARFRLTATTSPGATGGSSVSGEVEDYVVNIAAPTTDFGDYQSFASASSTVVSTLKMGALTDAEYAQTVNLTATGDDTTGSDDEDGVIMPALTAGGPATIPVTVTNTSGAAAFLNAWIDYNNNGTLEAGEQIASNASIADGTTNATQNINVIVPVNAVTGVNLGVRFRLTSLNTTTATGASGNGEVEDYVANIAAPTTDFGDFSGFANASNGISPNIRIGALTDAEFSATKTSAADGDDTTDSDDEDGVTLSSMTAGAPATLTVTATNNTGAVAYLNAWIDYNNNGVLTDSGEQVATNTNIANGTNGGTQTINFTVPATAVTGTNLGVRVRLTSVTTPGATGTGGGSGEVEDYVVSIAVPTTDFGDFQTFGSASSTVIGTLKMGALADTEYVQTANLLASGDDSTGSDDEDGVIMPTLTAGGPATIPVVVTNNSGAEAFLNAWIDYNNNGTLEAGEQIASNVSIADGVTAATQTLNITVPATAVTGLNLGARFRLTSVNTTAATGASGNGEVEDYLVNIATPTTDFGDFISFGNASNGISSNIRIGALTDGEFSATKDATATGDDATGSDDEDGVTISSLTAGGPGTLTVTVTNNTGAVAYLNAWLDYNNNGVLTDPGDQIATNVNIATGITNGTQTVNFTVPATAVTGTNLGVRVRLTSTIAPGATGTGGGSGEVEDYVVAIAAPTTDFGDDSFLASASSVADGNLKLGTLTDTEYAQTANSTATGDDTTGSDDEDAVTMPPLMAGAPATIPVIVTNNTGAVAYLNAWIDYNNNGTLEAGEQIATNLNIDTGTTAATQNLSITVLGSAVTGVNVGARFRLTSVSTTTATGASGNGEVEDYVVNITAPPSDFGDFSSFADASSASTTALRMGAMVDTEFTSTRNGTATGDDNTGSDDEDGVTLPSMTAGAPATIPVVVTNTTGSPAYLNAWMDSNNNGTLEAGEQIATDVVIATGTSGATQNISFTVPASTVTGTTLGLRFRLTSTMTPGPTGPSGNGEVEDYVTTVAVPTTDFGDLSGASDAWSTATSNLRIGSLADTEYVSTRNATATGDDTTGSDDEDGVTVPASITLGAPGSVIVNVTNTTGAVAYLNAWIDYNRNNSFADAGEQIAANVNIATGTNGLNQTINFTVPVGATTGSAGVRVRLTSVSTTTSVGASGSGEVEDYVTNIVIPTTDFGDLTGTDASSTMVSTLKIGATTDTEYVSTKNATATGDDTTGTDDEDGVTMPASINTGAVMTIPVTVSNTTGAVAYLNAWIDYNANGSFADAGEQIAANINIASGTSGAVQNVTFTVPTTASLGASRGARFRLTSVSTTGPTGASGNGEVEDYTVTISQGLKLGNLVWNDVNNNGSKDASESGLDGVAVQLCTPGGDGAVNTADDVVVSSTTTSGGGLYAFAGLSPADYFIKVTPPAGYPIPGGTPATIDNNVDGNNDGSQPGAVGTAVFSPKINLAIGAESTSDGDTDANTNLTVDFGLFSGIQLGNLVWNDSNNNGLYDAGSESGISGLTVELLNGTTSAVITSTTTNASGVYGFTVFTTGSYMVRVTPNGAYPLATTSVNLDNGADSDSNGVQTTQGTPATSPVITLTAGGEPGTGGTGNVEATIDFGFRTCPTIAVNPASLPDGFVNTLYSQTVSATGGIGSATFAVSSGALPLWATLDPNTGLISGTPNATGTTSFTIRATDSVGCLGTRAFTISIRSLKVGNLVWSDLNNNGAKDAGEPGLSGIAVELWSAGVNGTEENGGGDDTKVATDVVTNASGIYTFSNVPAGSNYYVRIPTVPVTHYISSGTPVVLDNGVDNDNNGQQSAVGGAVRSPKFTLAGGTEPVSGVDGDDADGELTIDFGLAPTVGVGNLVFKDVNNNGIYEAGTDTVVDGVTLQLFTSGSDPLTATPLATTTTAGGGLYGFFALPGSYFVYVPASQFDIGGILENTRPSLEPAGVPAVDDNGDQNALATAKPVVTGVSTGVFTLAVGTEPTTASGETGYNSSSDSAYDSSADLTIDLGFYPTGTPGFPLAGRVKRDLPGLGDPTTATDPLPGVEVALYSDTNGNGILDTEEMSAIDTVVTDESGDFAFDSQPSGEYLVVQTVPSGSLATYDTDGGDPATTSVMVTSAPVEDIEFLQAVCPDTFVIWQSQHALGGSNAAGDNPDGDFSSNLLEYALGTAPDRGSGQRKFWLEANASGGIDAVLVRTTTGHLDVSYSIEGSGDLSAWSVESLAPAISSNNDGTETIRFANVSSPFIRLKVALDADHNGVPEATATSQAQAWHREEFGVGQQSFSMPLLRDEVFAGIVSSVDDRVLAGITPSLTASGTYYAEVISGALEGHRYEIDVAASGSAGISLIVTAPAELAGSRVVVRPHWTVGMLFPSADFHATSSSKTADRVMFFDAMKQSYRVLWLYSSNTGPRWVRDGDTSLSDAGGTVVGPADAVIVQPRSAPVSGLFIGQVRSWRFVVALLQGSQFVAGGFPVDQSPADRGMTTGFSATADATDRFQLWKGDVTSGATGYDTWHASSAGTGVIWLSETGDDVTHVPAFAAFRGVFVSSSQGIPSWDQPAPGGR